MDQNKGLLPVLYSTVFGTVFGGLAACGRDPSVVVFKQVFVEIDIDRTVAFSC